MRVAKTELAEHAARHLADIEAQIATEYTIRNEAWQDVTAAAEKAVARADAEVAARCRELGIPEQFRPGLNIYWYSRGENASAERRVELRRVAKAELDARVKTAQTVLERHGADLLTQLMAGSLESAEGRAFLQEMPSVDGLLPAIPLSKVEEVFKQLHGKGLSGSAQAALLGVTNE
jgi:hypothetical protein